ncbi:MAG: hypothetical protein Q8N36_02790, partial [bacterium]|nr:hypothetical protein [bacterium]
MKWHCTVCKNVFDYLPDICPVCASPKEKFVPHGTSQEAVPSSGFVHVLDHVKLTDGHLNKIVNYKTEQLGVD